MMDLGEWLRSIGLERYEAAFRENAIAADVLRDLTDQDLEKIGVLLGDRRRLLRAIAELDKAPISAVPPAAAPSFSRSTSGSAASPDPAPAPGPSTSASVVSSAPELSPSRSTSGVAASPPSSPSPSRSTPALTASPAPAPSPSRPTSIAAAATSQVSAEAELSGERPNVVSLRPHKPDYLKTPAAKEGFAFEDAIRQVATETTSKSQTQTRAPARSKTAVSGLPISNRVNQPQPDLPGADWSDALLSARQRLLIARSSRKRQQVPTLRDSEPHDPGTTTAKAPQTSRPPRSSFEAVAPQYPPVEEATATFPKRDRQFDLGPGQVDYEMRQEDDLEPADELEQEADLEPADELEQEADLEPADELEDHQQEADLEPADEPEDEELWAAAPARDVPPPAQDVPPPARRISPPMRHVPPPRHAQPPAAPDEQKRPSLSYGGLARLLVVLLILAGLAAAISWQRSAISEIYQLLSHIGEKPQSGVTAQPEFSPRDPEEQAVGKSARAAAQGSQTALPAASLIEADSSDPQGKRYVGSVVWRTETIPGGAGLAPELIIRGDIEIPERRMTVTWSMRRNTDKTLPASHTIEILFNLPTGFAAGGIANVTAIVMKQSEEARGNKLAALYAKVTNGFFLVGLSAANTDVQRDSQLLKDCPWFDIGIVYTNGTQAILALEKGEAGNRAFAQAFAAWDKK
jgi:SAM domain (Sterile alpha motif)